MNPLRSAHFVSKFRLLLLSLVALGVLGPVGDAPGAAGNSAGTLVYFGTYTGPKSRGIYLSRLDNAAGRLAKPDLAAEATSPSFLAVHPNGRFLYAVVEVNKFDGKPAGAVSAFAIDPQSGKLSALNEQSSMGAGPCHLMVDPAGKHVLVANYGSGSVAVLPLRQDGTLEKASSFIQHAGSSVNPQRQEGPHAHGIYLDAEGRLAFVPDLGLDKVEIYRFDAGKGTLAPNDPPFAAVAPGSGPRHFAFHPQGRFAYVINEIACTVTAFRCEAKRGELREVQTLSTLPEGEPVKPSYSTAELFAHPSGKFLYGSNRGHNSIVVYSIDDQTGKLRLVEHAPTQGKTPRGFGIDPDGRWLLVGNQDSDNVVVFRIDPRTGRLTPTGQTIEVGAPVSVVFVK